MLLGAVVVTGLSVWTLTRPEVVPANVMRFTIVPPEDAPLSLAGNPHDLAISPDGTFVVYDGPIPNRPGAGPQLHVRPIDQPVGAPLRGSEFTFGPFVSPDGEWIGFSEVPLVDDPGQDLARRRAAGDRDRIAPPHPGSQLGSR